MLLSITDILETGPSKLISFPETRRNQNAPIQTSKEGGGPTAMVLEAKLRGGMPHAEALP
jgi:hypothetical protein